MKEYKFKLNYQEYIDNDLCPVVDCEGQLDTGWECNDCGFDAMYHASDQFNQLTKPMGN